MGTSVKVDWSAPPAPQGRQAPQAGFVLSVQELDAQGNPATPNPTVLNADIPIDTLTETAQNVDPGNWRYMVQVKDVQGNLSPGKTADVSMPFDAPSDVPSVTASIV